MGEHEHDELSTLRHSASHVMADAVKQLFPGVKLAIGPAIDDGFYYDFLVDKPFTPDDLEKIDRAMRKIVKRNAKFERVEMSYGDARDFLEKQGENLKLELLEDHRDEAISFYRHGEFIDMCAGPHVGSVGALKAFKLLKVAGAYWRGDENNVMLQRIYGTAFKSKEQLDEHLTRLAEAEKRDHRKLGVELDLFSIHQEDAGPGLIYWHPRGSIIRELAENFWLGLHKERGYMRVYTPHLVKVDLWKTSGHYQMQYPMYFTKIDNDEYGVKPMNCPGHILIYKTRTRSYRDLPMRFAEMGTVYRHEKSGVLHGMMRVRGFTQDDAHIFCTQGQLLDEMVGVLDMVALIMGRFGFDYRMMLSTRPEKSVGSDENWETATNALRNALETRGIPYEVDPGEGVFYGPKIDVELRDAIGREWQGPTIQVDFNLPERFGMEYIGEDGAAHAPVMIHRAIFGSFERFFGILTEHFAGAFPLWIAPEQATVLPLSDRHRDAAHAMADRLAAEGFRVIVDDSSNTIGAKIRNAQLMKIPYMLILGDKEIEAGAVAVRCRKEGDLGQMPFDKLAEMLREKLTE